MADNLETNICPQCGKEMKKFYIQNHKFHVDICIDGCGGIWFDNRELKKVDDVSKNIDEITENKYDVIQEIIREKQLLQLEYGLASDKKEII